ncbi:MAG TPA: ImmA/IrrE family metallo-endopeptidase [bacterium]|nr:ImmA/IrrE family metallo-endopeptidase [bacterium]
MLAEELGHIVLNHQLVESTDPRALAIGLLEGRRVIYEREGRTFAAELLMPLPEVRWQWFHALRERFGPDHEASREELVRQLAKEFAVTLAATRIRLTGLRLTSG